MSAFRLAGHTALDFLTWLRFQPALAEIPVVMLSGVASGLSPERGRQIGAAALILKSADVGCWRRTWHRCCRKFPSPGP
jgi:hypothetical protein